MLSHRDPNPIPKPTGSGKKLPGPTAGDAEQHMEAAVCWRLSVPMAEGRKRSRRKGVGRKRPTPRNTGPGNARPATVFRIQPPMGRKNSLWVSGMGMKTELPYSPNKNKWVGLWVVPEKEDFSDDRTRYQ